jgi:pimeloyl-ACP methyl ester carboxylesterase
MTRMAIESGIRAAEIDIFRRFQIAPVETVIPIEADGTTTSIRVLSFGEGQPILFLHAASWFAAHWSELCSLLKGYRCHCVDMPGHGLSGAADYSGKTLRAFQVELFGKVARALGLRKAPVIGNSLGGMTALWLALGAPQLVDRVVILGVPATALRGARPDLILSLLSTPYLRRNSPVPSSAGDGEK